MIFKLIPPLSGLTNFVSTTVPHHSPKFSLETFQIIVSFPIELIEFDIFLLQVFNLPNNLFYLFQLVGQVLVFMLDLCQLPFNYDQLFVMAFKSLLHHFQLQAIGLHGVAGLRYIFFNFLLLKSKIGKFLQCPEPGYSILGSLL